MPNALGGNNLPRKKSKQTSNKQEETKSTNGYDVLIHLINAFYNLANTGNVVGIIFLGVTMVAGIVAWKLPPENVPEVVQMILELRHTYVGPLGAALAISIFANFYQRKVYHMHIETLLQNRDELIYGTQRGQYTQLTDHRTSGINVEDTDHDC